LIADSPTERGDNFSLRRFASRARTIIRAYSARASDDTLLHRLRAISAAVIAFFFIRMMIAGRCAVVKRMLSPRRARGKFRRKPDPFRPKVLTVRIVNVTITLTMEQAEQKQLTSEAARALRAIAIMRDNERRDRAAALEVEVVELRARLDEQRKVFELLGMALPAQVKQAAAKD
jgi:hypothetical protein